MRKITKWIVTIVVILFVALVLALIFIPGHIVKATVEKGGEFALQVPVHLKGASLGLFFGKLELNGFLVENPEGYDTSSAIEAGRIFVRAPILSLLGSKPRIEEIVVESPVITLEQGLTSSNLYDLMKNAQRFEKDEEEGEKKAKKEGKKMVIGTLRITGAKVNLSTIVSQRQTVSFVLPPIELNELGGDNNQGVTTAQTIAIALREIVKSAATSGSGLLPKGLSKSLNASVVSFDQTREQLMGAVGDARKKAGQTLGSAQDQAAESLGDASKKVTSGLRDAASGLMEQTGAAESKKSKD